MQSLDKSLGMELSEGLLLQQAALLADMLVEALVKPLVRKLARGSCWQQLGRR